VPAEPSTVAAPGAAARLAVDVRRFPWIRPLAGEYAFNFDRVAAFYAGDPQAPHAWQEAYRRVQQRARARVELAACLGAQQAAREAPQSARDNVSRLADARTAAIVTGQQAGVFGGPLYTLLKAISAIQLARRTEAALGAPVVPIFWVDAEDHDWAEVAGSTVLDRELRPHTITLRAVPGAGELPVAALGLPDGVTDAIASLCAAMPGTDFTGWIREMLQQAYVPRRGLADAFARLLEALLGPHGLIVCDAFDPRLKPLAAAVFRREIQTAGRTAALAQAAGEELAALGHAPQVTPQPGSLALLSIDGARRPIRTDDGGFLLGERRTTAGALAEDAAAHPERFSPNVLLRPIVQDTLFPTVCYVAGPSELAYLGQLRHVYEHFEVPMPLVHPRATATLVDSATLRFLAKYEIALEQLQPQDEAALNRLLAAQLPAAVETAFDRANEAVRRALGEIAEAVPRVDPTLSGASQTTLGKLEHEIRTLRGKVVQAAKKRDETLRRQFRRAQLQIFPSGQPQERLLACAYFLNLYGPALVDRLLDELPLEAGHHWVMTV
jgi:bacillithiol synthase